MLLLDASVLNLPIQLAPWFNAIVVKSGYIWTVSGNQKMH